MGESRASGGVRAGARDRLLAAADELFYSEGIRATGVDAIATRAGVTKMTLYSHFGSKDGLISAYLRERDRRWSDFLERKLAEHADPADQVLTVFDAYREWLVAERFRGCGFINCAAEFPDRAHPARTAVNDHKLQVRERLAGLVAATQVDRPGAVAQRLFLLLEGAYVTSALEGDAAALNQARAFAHTLLKAQG